MRIGLRILRDSNPHLWGHFRYLLQRQARRKYARAKPKQQCHFCGFNRREEMTMIERLEPTEDDFGFVRIVVPICSYCITFQKGTMRRRSQSATKERT